MTDGGFTRLYIWKQSAIEFCKKYFMIGGGIGSTKYFIQGTLGRFESNVHNIFLNIFFEFGLIGFCIYTKFLFEFLKNVFRNKLFKNIFVIVIPMLIIVSLQYLGYDNDLMVLIMLSIINKLENEQVIVEYV